MRNGDGKTKIKKIQQTDKRDAKRYCLALG